VLIGSFGWTIDVEEPAAPTEKQRLRGWLHVVMFPIAILGGIAIVVFANSSETRLSFAVFALVAALLFGTSALLHRGTWTPRVEGVLRRTDHSNIYLIIAATYPPFAALAMPEGRGRVLLFIVLIALGGVLYNAAAGVYGTRWQNPSPEWFGFHEVFHALTVVAFAARYLEVRWSSTPSTTLPRHRSAIATQHRGLWFAGTRRAVRDGARVLRPRE
jgi:hemolysin III